MLGTSGAVPVAGCRLAAQAQSVLLPIHTQHAEQVAGLVEGCVQLALLVG